MTDTVKHSPFERFEDRISIIEEFIAESVSSFADRNRQKSTRLNDALLQLRDCIRYSLSNGGKRVRPLLGIFLAEAIGVPPKKVLPWLCAIEMVHTYSLIHDDLPSMDNDDFRRGKPTNHRVFGEACALLSGDVILTEAFGVLARNYSGENCAIDPKLALEAVLLLSDGAGFTGMGGGQAVDLLSKATDLSEEDLLQLHSMKTGALFRISCEGVAILSGMPTDKRHQIRDFGASLGLCFQLADDLIDSAEKIEAGSMPALIGLEATRKLLTDESLRALATLEALNIHDGPLIEIVEWNQSRRH